MASTAPSQRQGLPLRHTLLPVVGLYLALYVAWVLWGREQPAERFLIGNLAMILTACVTAALSLWIQQHVSLPTLRAAWVRLTLALSLWALADILRLAGGLFALDGPALLAAVDLLHAAGALCFWAGLVRYPRRPRPTFGRLSLLLDTTLVTAAVLTLVWIMVLEPILAANPGSPWQTFNALLRPMVDLGSLLLLINLFLLSDTTQLPLPYGWIGLGLTSYAFSDLAYASLRFQGAYPGGGPMDIGWVIGDVCLAVAILIQAWQYEAAPSPGSKLWLRLVARLQSLLPLLTTLVLGWYALLEWQIGARLNLLGLWMTIVLGLGLIARQGILAGEVELQQYANLVNSVAEPAFVCDSRGVLRLANPALLKATGYEQPSDLLSRPLQHLLHPAADVPALIHLGLADGWTGEYFLRRRDGALVPISLALRPLRPAGDNRLALAGTAHDLSEQKKQQAALRAAYEQIAADRAELERMNVLLEQKVSEKTASLSEAYHQLEQQHQALQKLDQLKSEFVSMVSHELRAPLTNISGGIELTLAGTRPDPQRTRQNLTLVQAEIRRLSRFVETILDISALDAGRLPLYPAPTSLPAVAEALARQMFAMPGIQRIRWQIPTDLPAVMADEQALASILFHLIDNAIKYAPTGEITVQAHAEDGRVSVAVLDAGPGIPAESLPMLFDRFYRLNAGDAQMVYGHGLGLYMVHRLLTAMDGNIQVNNRPEGGACFTFWLNTIDAKDD
jgi:PAS domain S-box-containing protein